MPLEGYTHSAFSFGNESLIAKSSVALTDIPPGALVTLMQKGLEYIGIEEHINEVQYPLTYVTITSLVWLFFLMYTV